jgi:hypothetical protein
MKGGGRVRRSEVCLAYMYAWVDADRDHDTMSNEPRRYTVQCSSVAWVNLRMA